MPTALRKDVFDYRELMGRVEWHQQDITADVERYWVDLSVPQARRYFRCLTDNMLNPERGMEHHTLTRGEARYLQTLLDALDKQAGGPPNKFHD